MWLARDDRLAGVIGIADPIKADSAEALERLKTLGLKLVMMTGDSPRTAGAVATSVRIDEVMAGVMPADNLVLTYAILGEYDTARDLADERIRAIPGTLTLTAMRLDPRWDGFLASPQFAELEKRLGSPR